VFLAPDDGRTYAVTYTVRPAPPGNLVPGPFDFDWESESGVVEAIEVHKTSDGWVPS